MRNPTSNETDVHYAISVLLAAGALVDARRAAHKHRRSWIVTAQDGRKFDVTEPALIELAHDEATRRRDDWQRTIEHVEQLAMFAHEDTPRYEVR